MKNNKSKPSPVKTRANFLFILKAFLFTLLGTAFLLTAIGMVFYMTVARTLPDVGDLQTKASQFQTTQILDRKGNLLYEIIDPDAGRRDYVSISDISPFVVAATIATEDKEFYNHPGFDLIAIVRAVIQNLEGGTTVSGASTITQQLARNLLLTAEERSQRSIKRKIKEIFLAAEITRRYTKDQILELYLNENYYSNFAYGIEAAAKTYFGIPAKYLDFAQSAFLAGLPQAPSVYDIFSNRDKTLQRHRTVLLLAYSLSRETNCIKVGNSEDPICVDELMVDRGIKEIEDYDFEQVTFPMKYPHWVNYIRTILEEMVGPQDLYRSGLTVYTSLDPAIQDIAQQTITAQLSQLSGNNVHNGALVAIAPQSGEILAMVGSPDFFDTDNAGQVNMATSPRQPGSVIKPLIYASAFEKGWTPATLLWDVPTEFSPTGIEADLQYSAPYVPQNYDNKFHGPVLLRDALGNSYNIPAIKALEFVGIYDNPVTMENDGFMEFAERIGLTSLAKPDYGLSIALGGGEVTLLEMTQAFNLLANNGRSVPLRPILKIYNSRDELIYEPTPSPDSQQVLRAEYAYQITSILSDNNARTPMFGSNSVLNLPFPAAVKTGTTNDFRDNLTIGYTPDLTTGVWFGNADYTPMIETTGLTGAAPAWSSFMQTVVPMLTENNPRSFSVPAGLTEMTICSVSGGYPSSYCPNTRTEIFAADQSPIPPEQDLWQNIPINTWNGKIANQFCPNSVKTMMTINVKDPWAQRWILSTSEGMDWAKSMNLAPSDQPIMFTPTESCAQGETEPLIQFVNLTDNTEIKSPITEIYAVVNDPAGIRNFSLEFGSGWEPGEWYVISSYSNRNVVQPEKIGDWNVTGLANGPYTLRVFVESTSGHFSEQRIHVMVNVDQQFLQNQQENEGVLVPVYGDQSQIPQFIQIP